MNKNWVHIGHLARAHGIKGEVAAVLFSGKDSCLKASHQVKVINKNQENLKTIESIRKGNKVLLKFEDVNSRDEAEGLSGFELYLQRKDFDDGEDIFLIDLIGCDVLDIETNENLGKIKDIYNNGAQEILVIEGEQSFEVPLVDQLVPKIDLEQRQVWLHPPEIIE